jgi:hypothetical protein
MYTRRFWLDTFERTVATMAQTALAIVGVDYVSALAVNFAQGARVVAAAGVLTVLKCLAASKVGAETAAMLPAEDGHADEKMMVGRQGETVTPEDGHADTALVTAVALVAIAVVAVGWALGWLPK